MKTKVSFSKKYTLAELLSGTSNGSPIAFQNGWYYTPKDGGAQFIYIDNALKVVGEANAVSSVNGKTGAVNIGKSDLGLGNVENKNVSQILSDAALTGTPTAPTPTDSSADNSVATKGYVDNQIGLEVNSIYRYKGSVENKAALPVGDVVQGDVYRVSDTNILYGCIVNAPNGVVPTFIAQIFVDGEIDYTKVNTYDGNMGGKTFPEMPASAFEKTYTTGIGIRNQANDTIYVKICLTKDTAGHLYAFGFTGDAFTQNNPNVPYNIELVDNNYILKAINSTDHSGVIGNFALDVNAIVEWTTFGGNIISVNGKTGVVVIDKNDVGLGNVENKSAATILDSAALTGSPTTALDPTTARGIASKNYVDTQISENLKSVYKFKGSVAKVADLQSLTNLKDGDVYNVVENGMNYAVVKQTVYAITHGYFSSSTSVYANKVNIYDGNILNMTYAQLASSIDTLCQNVYERADVNSSDNTSSNAKDLYLVIDSNNKVVFFLAEKNKSVSYKPYVFVGSSSGCVATTLSDNANSTLNDLNAEVGNVTGSSANEVTWDALGGIFDVTGFVSRDDLDGLATTYQGKLDAHKTDTTNTINAFKNTVNGNFNSYKTEVQGIINTHKDAVDSALEDTEDVVATAIAGVREEMDTFGTAAHANTGAAAGNVPIIGSDGNWTYNGRIVVTDSSGHLVTSTDAIGNASSKNAGALAGNVPLVGSDLKNGTLNNPNGYPVLLDSNGKLKPGSAALGSASYKGVASSVAVGGNGLTTADVVAKAIEPCKVLFDATHLSTVSGTAKYVLNNAAQTSGTGPYKGVFTTLHRGMEITVSFASVVSASDISLSLPVYNNGEWADGAYNVLRSGTDNVADILDAGVYKLVFDGSQWQILGGLGGGIYWEE